LQIAMGVVAFLVWTWEKKQWPFQSEQSAIDIQQ